MWLSRCQIRTGSLAGTVTGLASDPPAYTRAWANEGMNELTGSVSSNAPSSYSIMAATVVIGLVMEKMRHRVLVSTGSPASVSRDP